MTQAASLRWVRQWHLLHTGSKRISVDVPHQAVTCSDDTTLEQVASAVSAALEECPTGDLTPVSMVPRRLVELTS
jgi:hypothetical protein